MALLPPPSSANPGQPWRSLARGLFWAFLVFTLTAFFVALPLRWQELSNPTAHLPMLYAQAGISIPAWAIFSLTSEVVFTTIYVLLGVLIFARRSNDNFALLTALMLVSFGLGNLSITPTMRVLNQYPGGEWVLDALAFVSFSSLGIFLCAFPGGWFNPRWMGLAALSHIIIAYAWTFLSGTVYFPPAWPAPIFLPILTASYLAPVAGQYYRYRKIYSPQERQQSKWALGGLFFPLLNDIVLGALVSWLVPGAFSAYENMLTASSGRTLLAIILLLPPGAARWHDDLVAGRVVRMGEPIGQLLGRT